MLTGGPRHATATDRATMKLWPLSLTLLLLPLAPSAAKDASVERFALHEVVLLQQP